MRIFQASWLAIVGFSSFVSTAVFADTTVTIPRPYVVYLVDGKPFKSTQTEVVLPKGDHQIVMRFEGNFSTRSNVEFVNAEPLVVNLTTNGKEELTFKLPIINDSATAKSFVKNQNIQLVDKNTNNSLKADISVLPKKEGLQIGRDYQQELLDSGKAFQQKGLETDFEKTAATVPASVNQQPFEMLKYWYSKSDPKTKKAFQHWVISQE